jgi:hypothetical protein
MELLPLCVDISESGVPCRLFAEFPESGVHMRSSGKVFSLSCGAHAILHMPGWASSDVHAFLDSASDLDDIFDGALVSVSAEELWRGL